MPTENLKKAAKQEKQELEEGFDNAIEEREKPTSEIEVLGKAFQIPSTPPAWVQLFVAKYGKGDQMELPPEKYLDYILKVLGDDLVDHIIDVADNNFDNVDFHEKVMNKITEIWYPKAKKK